VRGLRAVIEKEIFLVQQGEEISYNAAMLKVAKEQPDLFLTMARLELGELNRTNLSISICRTDTCEPPRNQGRPFRVP